MSTTTVSPVRVGIVTTKRGIDLSTFEDVTLYKVVVPPARVEKVNDALALLGNDHSKLMSIINQGLAADAVATSRKNMEGWCKMDDDGKQTTEVFSGQLASTEVVNPIVLMFAKLSFDYESATTPEAKKAAKQAAKDYIRTVPKILEDIQKKSAATVELNEENS